MSEFLQNDTPSYIFVPPGPTPPPPPGTTPAITTPTLKNATQATWGTTIPVSSGNRCVTGVQIWVADPRRSGGETPPENPPPVDDGMDDHEYFEHVCAVWELSDGLRDILALFVIQTGGDIEAACVLFLKGEMPSGDLGPHYPTARGFFMQPSTAEIPLRDLGTPAPTLPPPPPNPEFVTLDFAVALGYSNAPETDRRVPRMVRMWANGIQVVGPLGLIENMPSDSGMEVKFYPGYSDQEPDPTIKAAMGEDCPAFRDLIYVVVKNFKMPAENAVIPEIRVELTDEVHQGAPLAEAFDTSTTSLAVGGSFVEPSLGLFYSFTGITNSVPYLHAYDMFSDREHGRIRIQGHDTSHLHVQHPFWTLHDKDNRMVLFQHGNNISNRMPVAAVQIDTGRVIDSFGVQDASLSSDEDGQATSWYADLVKFRSAGIDVYELVTGGIFTNVNFMRYAHSSKPVTDIKGNPVVRDFGGPVDYSDFFLRWDGVIEMASDVREVKAYPILDRPELQAAWKVQENMEQPGCVMVGVDNSIVGLTFNVTDAGSSGETVALQAGGSPVINVNVFDERTLFRLNGQIEMMFIEPRTGDVMVLTSSGGTRCYINRLRPHWSKLSDNSIMMTGMHAVYKGRPIEQFVTGSLRASAVMTELGTGKFGYFSGARFVIYDIDSLNLMYDEVFPTTGDDFYFNWSSKSVVVTDGIDDKVTRVHLYGDATTDGVLLTDFMRWAALRLGYAEEDISHEGIDDEIIGSFMDSPTPIRQLMGTMSEVFDFSVVETGGRIKFTRKERGTSVETSATITKETLAQLQEGGENTNALTTTIAAPDEVPADVQINYIDASMDYMSNTQIYRRVRFPFQTVKTKRTAAYSVPIVMTPNDALSRAARLVYANFANSVVYEWRLPQRHLALEPSDVVTIYDRTDFPVLVQITQVTYNADYSITCGGVNWSFKDLTSEDVTLFNEVPRGYKPPVTVGPSNSEMFAFDIPLLNPGHNVSNFVVVYTGVGSLGQTWWQGANVTRRLNTEPETQLYSTRSSLSYGSVDIALPASNTLGTTFMADDHTVLTVSGRSLRTDQLISSSEQGLLHGVNRALIGRPGRWELIHFRDVTVVDEFTVELRGILRGRRGTDVHCDTHDPGDLVVFLNHSTLRADRLTDADIGKVANYVAAGFNTNVKRAVSVSPVTGASHQPWAVTGINIRRGEAVNNFPDPDYDNLLGGGTVLDASDFDRRGHITVTGTSINNPSLLVNGDATNDVDNSATFVNGATDVAITLDFRPAGFKQIIDEFQWVQNVAHSQGTYTWEASDDGSAWTTLQAGINLGGASSVTTVSYSNTTGYWFYRLRQTAGTASSTQWLKELYLQTKADVGANDLLIEWLRRDRLSPATVFITDDQPMTEQTEAYEVDILDPSTGAVLRTFENLILNRAIYTSAMQTSDGFTPPMASVRLKAYQMSTLVGRGLTMDTTVEVTS